LKFIISIFLIGSFFLLTACTPERKPAEGALSVIASIQPLGDFVKQIGQDAVSVRVVVPPGSNPHTFDLTPELVRAASKAQLLVYNGAGLEFWAEKLKENSANSSVRTVIISSGIALLGGHEHGNPHVWLDPLYALRAVEMIRDALVSIKPEKKDMFLRNADIFIDSLKALDAWIKTEISSWKEKRFVAYHASWDYFALRYGLEEVATLEKTPGRELSVRELGDILNLIKENKIVALFGEVQSPVMTMSLLAKETNARLVVLDPLGGMESTKTYLAMMRYNVLKMSAAMR